MTVLNDLDRFHLVQDVIHWVGSLGRRGTTLKQTMTDTLSAHKQYIDKHGVDMPEIRNWKWNTQTQMKGGNHADPTQGK